MSDTFDNKTEEDKPSINEEKQVEKAESGDKELNGGIGDSAKGDIGKGAIRGRGRGRGI